MADFYQVRLRSQAQRQLSKLPPQARERLLQRIHTLVDDPRPHGCVKLTGSQKRYRLRVGSYRIIYEILDAELVIMVVDVGDRKDIYRK